MFGDFIHIIKEWIEYIFLLITELGYWGIMLGLMIEVIPSEIVLSYGGYLVSQGNITFWGAVLFGTIGGTIAQIFVYWIGRYGGRPFLEKYGKYIFIHKKQIDLSEKWFNRYGTGMIFTARFIPIVRHAISIPAGMARMSLTRFTILTTLAVIPWSIFFIYLGKSLGENWREIDEKAGPFIVPFIIGSVLLTVLYFIYKITKRKMNKSRNDYGLQGEKNTAHQLKFIGREYKVLHHRLIQSGNHQQEIDHIVMGPNGVFHIESKHWSGEILFTEQGIKRDEGRVSEDPTAQMYRHEYIIKEQLRQHKIQSDVTGILCFTHLEGSLVGQSPAFTTLKLDRLLHFIKSYKPKKILSKEEINKIEQILKTSSKTSR